MADLAALEATATHAGPQSFKPATPLILPAWVKELATHPDKSFAAYILTGMQKGFHIGADRGRLSLRPGPGNLPSVYQHPHLIDTHIAGEVEQGRMLGPVPDHLSPHCHCNPIGLIPKPHQPGRWRLIVDLSAPRDHSVNNAIPSDVAQMHYSSVLDAAAMVRSLGPGALLAKMDLQNAYRILPVHADDHPLLAIRWKDATYLDTALPFGL